MNKINVRQNSILQIERVDTTLDYRVREASIKRGTIKSYEERINSKIGTLIVSAVVIGTLLLSLYSLSTMFPISA